MIKPRRFLTAGSPALKGKRRIHDSYYKERLGYVLEEGPEQCVVLWDNGIESAEPTKYLVTVEKPVIKRIRL